MKKILPLGLMIMLVSCIIFNKASGQYNLVPNPSFEVFDTCPSYQNQGKINWAPPWNKPLHFTTPDYMNACDTVSNFNVPNNVRGFEYAHTGFAYAFIATFSMAGNPQARNYREYVQAPLSDSLISGTDYCIRFYVSASDSSNYVSNNIGIYFSTYEINDTCAPIPCNLPYIPQFENDSNNNLNNRNGWTEVSGTYTAAGGEKYIVIGNFRDSAATVATYTGWSFQTLYAGYYIDDILITPCDSLTGLFEPHLNFEINVFPNPSDGTYKVESKNEPIEKIRIRDMSGKLILDINYFQSKVAIINLLYEPSGIYFLSVSTKNKIYQFKLIKIN